MAPCSDSPDKTLEEYGRQINKQKSAAKNQGVMISDEDKTTHFVRCAKVSGLFKEEWVTEWEAKADILWMVVRNIWVRMWLEITRAVTIAEKRGGYESDAESNLRAHFRTRHSDKGRIRCQFRARLRP